MSQRKKSAVFRVNSNETKGQSEIVPVKGREVEYFFASDASAIIEHTDRVIYLEDDDVAAVKNGKLSLHRDTRSLDENANRCGQPWERSLIVFNPLYSFHIARSPRSSWRSSRS